jgi:hypothetical protein
VIVAGRHLEQARATAAAIGHGVRGREIDVTVEASVAEAAFSRTRTDRRATNVVTEPRGVVGPRSSEGAHGAWFVIGTRNKTPPRLMMPHQRSEQANASCQVSVSWGEHPRTGAVLAAELMEAADV